MSDGEPAAGFATLFVPDDAAMKTGQGRGGRQALPPTGVGNPDLRQKRRSATHVQWRRFPSKINGLFLGMVAEEGFEPPTQGL